MIFDLFSQNNVEEIRQKIENTKKENQQDIYNCTARQQEVLNKMKETGIIEDSKFNEALREEAEMLLEKERQIPEEFIAKEMPECLNFDSVSYK